MVKKSQISLAQSSYRLVFIVAMMIIIPLISINLISGASWGSGMIAYWNMTNDTSTNIPDATGNNHNITLTTGFGINPKRVPGLLNYAQNGSNSTSFMNVTGNLSTLRNFDRNFSMFMWINFSTGSPAGASFHQFFNYGSWSWGIQSGRMVIQNETSGTLIGGTQDIINYADSKWYLIGIVVNQTNFTFYVNGTSTKTYDANIFASNNTALITFKDEQSPYLTLPYIFDEMGIWNRPITQSEINKIYNNHKGAEYIPNNPNIIFDDFYYNEQTTEGGTESFAIDVVYNSTYYPNSIGYLVYNNTVYSSTKTGNGNANFNTTINIPLVTASLNNTFYWSIGLINATGTYFFNSTSKNQTVLNMGIDDCSSFSDVVLNYTLKDEITQNLLNGTIELNVQVYSLTGNLLIMNLSKSYSNFNNAKVCINSTWLGSSSYRLDAQAKYYNESYVTRYNYIQNFQMSNSTIPQQITLFDLQSSLATKFLMTYKGPTFLGVDGALISINKQYLSENVYKTVEIEKTDQYGQASGWFDVNGKFQIVVSKDGEILSTFDNILVYCNSAVSTCTINLDASSEFTSAEDYYTYGNFTFSESFDKNTRLYTLNFATTDMSIANMRINLTRFDMYGNTSLCSNSVSTSSGSLTCTIPISYNNVTFVAEVYKDGIQISNTVFSITPDAKSSFAGSLVVFVFGIVLFFGMILIPSPIGVVLGTIIGVAVASVLFFINGSIGLGAGFIFLVIIGFIIIWRLRQGGSD